MLVFGILLRSAVGRLSWSSERGKQFSTENINRLGKACVLHGLGARFHTPLHSCAFSDERSTGKDTRKSADAQKVKIASKMSAQPIVFVFFFARFFLFDFSLSNGTKTPLFRDNFRDLGRFSPTSQADFANQRDGPSFNDFCNEKRRDGLKKSQKHLHQKNV